MQPPPPPPPPPGMGLNFPMGVGPPPPPPGLGQPLRMQAVDPSALPEEERLKLAQQQAAMLLQQEERVKQVWLCFFSLRAPALCSGAKNPSSRACVEQLVFFL